MLHTQICAKLAGIAVIFHEKIEVVDEAVRSAVEHHITKTQNILDYVKTYLVERANNFKCEDVLSSTVSQLVNTVFTYLNNDEGLVGRTGRFELNLDFAERYSSRLSTFPTMTEPP